MRLLRNRWRNATLLAEELYAMMNDYIPLTHKGPLTLLLPPESTDAPLTIRNWGSGPMIRFEGRDNEPRGEINNEGKLVDEEGEERGNQNQRGQQVDFEAYPGRVASGSGATYQVHLYPDGVNPYRDGMGNPINYTVKQLQIDIAETIPVGTWTTVFRRGTFYWMQVPVWLPP